MCWDTDLMREVKKPRGLSAPYATSLAQRRYQSPAPAQPLAEISPCAHCFTFQTRGLAKRRYGTGRTKRKTYVPCNHLEKGTELLGALPPPRGGRRNPHRAGPSRVPALRHVSAATHPEFPAVAASSHGPNREPQSCQEKGSGESSPAPPQRTHLPAAVRRRRTLPCRHRAAPPSRSPAPAWGGLQESSSAPPRLGELSAPESAGPAGVRSLCPVRGRRGARPCRGTTFPGVQRDGAYKWLAASAR